MERFTKKLNRATDSSTDLLASIPCHSRDSALAVFSVLSPSKIGSKQTDNLPGFDKILHGFDMPPATLILE